MGIIFKMEYKKMKRMLKVFFFEGIFFSGAKFLAK